MKKQDQKALLPPLDQLASQKLQYDQLLTDYTLLQSRLRTTEQELQLINRRLADNGPIMRSLEASYRKEKQLKGELYDLKGSLTGKNIKIEELEGSLRSERDKKDREIEERLEKEALERKKELDLIKSEIFRQNNQKIAENRRFSLEKEDFISKIEALEAEKQEIQDKAEALVDINEALIRRNETLESENKQMKREIKELGALAQKNTENPPKQAPFLPEDEEAKELELQMIVSEEIIIPENEP